MLTCAEMRETQPDRDPNRGEPAGDPPGGPYPAGPGLVVTENFCQISDWAMDMDEVATDAERAAALRELPDSLLVALWRKVCGRTTQSERIALPCGCAWERTGVGQRTARAEALCPLHAWRIAQLGE